MSGGVPDYSGNRMCLKYTRQRDNSMTPTLALLLLLPTIPQEKPTTKETVSVETQTKVKQNLVKAEQAALKIDEKHEQICAIAEIGEVYAKAQLREDAKRLLKRAEELSKAEGLPKDRLTSVRLTPIFRGYLDLDDVDSAVKVLECIPKDKIPPVEKRALLESHAAELHSKNKLVEELIIRNKLAEADRLCSEFIDAAKTISIEWHLKPIGMLAYAYYKQGRQKDLERLLKPVSGRSTRGALFFRDTFAAQAYWHASNGRKAQSKLLLDTAKYWQESYEKLASTDVLKESRQDKWAQLQARAGDATGAKSTLATLTTRQTPILLGETVTYPSFSWSAQELIGIVEPETILDFLKTPFGNVPLTEVELVLGLKMIALLFEERHDEKTAQLFWKAAHVAMKHDQEHAFVTKGLVYSRMHEIDSNATYKQKSVAALKQVKQYFDQEWSKHTLGMTIIDPLKLSWRLQDAKDYAGSFAMIKETLPTAINETRFGRDDDKTGLMIMEVGWLDGRLRDYLHVRPQEYQQMVDVVDSMKDKTLQSDAYCGIARSLLPRHFRESKDSFNDAFGD